MRATQKTIEPFVRHYMRIDEVGEYLPGNVVSLVSANIMYEFENAICGALVEKGFLMFSVRNARTRKLLFKCVVRDSNPEFQSIVDYRITKK